MAVEGCPMWKPEHRRAAERRGSRYPSDLSEAEWALIEPMIPPAKRGGRRREVNVREVLNAIFYVLSTGCQWQALPDSVEKVGACVGKGSLIQSCRGTEDHDGQSGSRAGGSVL